MRRGVILAVLVVGAIFLGAMTAQAAPSLEGYTGLLLTPTADALDQGEYNVAFFTLNLEEGADKNVFAASFGVAAGAEVGFARVRPEGGSGETILNAKYCFRGESAAKPAFAVGVIDATDEVNTTAYFVASKSLSRTLRMSGEEMADPRIHLGIAGGQIDGLFFGASMVLGDRLTLIAEYDTEDINLGARLALGHGLRAHAGWIHGLDDFAIGASFNKAF